jgi:hypothetical protein
MNLQLPATIEKISTRADNTISIVISTQEMKPEASTALFGLKGKLGWFLFAETTLTEQEIPKEPAPEFKNDKSPSQRIRACLYKYWEKNTAKKIPFDTFYKSWVEKKIQEIKDTLN